MTEEMKKKYSRLYDRLNELSTLNTNIAKLAFYLNENDIEDKFCELSLHRQLDAMTSYREALQERITNGYF